MNIIRHPSDMQRWSLDQRRAGTRIALVPTMGYLHDGHLSLVQIARSNADCVVVSLFVNPTQFGPNEDFAKYPRDWGRDERLCREAGVDILFAPAAEEMYAPDASIAVVERILGGGLCGRSRPGHFDGVCTVVTKLFNLVQPHRAVFGEKDAQQLRIIRRLVRDLDIPVEILAGPTIREPDGLALSSRNARLSAEERAQAICLRRALDAMASAFAEGERDADVLRKLGRRVIDHAPLARLDYLELVDDESLAPVLLIERPTLVAVAVNFPSARLIDNTVLRP